MKDTAHAKAQAELVMQNRGTIDRKQIPKSLTDIQRHLVVPGAHVSGDFTFAARKI